jgi:hypothetical protein
MEERETILAPPNRLVSNPGAVNLRESKPEDLRGIKIAIKIKN